jgi:hypothetical protein
MANTLAYLGRIIGKMKINFIARKTVELGVKVIKPFLV